MTDAPDTQADNMANALFIALTTDASFTLPTLDIESTDFDFPTTQYPSTSQLTEADLTSRTVGGSGLFDGLMESIGAQLTAEFEAGRITAKEYSTSYVALSQSAMSSAVQYLLQKDQQYWQAELIKQQAAAAELGVIQAKLQVEQLKAQVIQTRMSASSMAAEYSLNKMRLATEEANINLVEAQKDLAASQKSQVDYQTSTVLPAEVSRVNKQVDVDTAQISRINYEVANVLPAQVSQTNKQVDQITEQITQIAAEKLRIDAQTDNIEYDTNSIKPAELSLLNKRVEIGSSEVSLATANVSKTNYETQSLLPAQKAKIDKDAAQVDYQTNNLLVSQKLNVDEDTAVKQYQKDYLMPAQKDNYEEQTEAHRAKTLDTRTDGTTAVSGSMGKQKALHDEQITAYKRDAEAKAVKMILETWITRKTVDEGTNLPSELDTSALNTLLSEMKTNLGFS